MMEGQLYFGKNFIDLYLDSLVLLQTAHHDYSQNSTSCRFITFCRGSIISSMISVECAANCCLAILDTPKPIKDEIDKLDYLGKFHYFTLKYPTSHQIDLSKVEVGRIRELKKIRNDYVHPKVLHGSLEKVKENHFRTKFDKKGYPMTGISCDPTTWDLPEAVKVSKVVTEFYNYFFLQVCQFSQRTTSAILVSDEEFTPDNPKGINFSAVKTFSEMKAEFGIAASFLTEI